MSLILPIIFMFYQYVYFLVFIKIIASLILSNSSSY